MRHRVIEAPVAVVLCLDDAGTQIDVASRDARVVRPKEGPAEF